MGGIAQAMLAQARSGGGGAPAAPGSSVGAAGAVGLINTGLQAYLGFEQARQINKRVQSAYESQVRRNWMERVQIRYNEIASTEAAAREMRRAQGKAVVGAPEAGSLSFQETINQAMHDEGVRATHRLQYEARMQQLALDYADDNAKRAAEGQMRNEFLALIGGVQQGLQSTAGLIGQVKSFEQAKAMEPLLAQVSGNQELLGMLSNVLRGMGLDIGAIEQQRITEKNQHMLREIQGTGPALGTSFQTR